MKWHRDPDSERALGLAADLQAALVKLGGEATIRELAVEMDEQRYIVGNVIHWIRNHMPDYAVVCTRRGPKPALYSLTERWEALAESHDTTARDLVTRGRTMLANAEALTDVKDSRTKVAKRFRDVRVDLDRLEEALDEVAELNGV